MSVLWKDVPGYEGIYEVSNEGMIRGKNGLRKLQINCHGYYYIKLCNNGHEKKYQVHRLVAKAFLPNPNEYKEINHKDENPKNNRVDNLEWCDRTYNNNYGTRNKRAGKAISEALSLPVMCFDKYGFYVKTYRSAKVAAKELGLKSHSGITFCTGKKRDKAGGFYWRYE